MFPGKLYFKNGFHFGILIHDLSKTFVLDIVFQINEKKQRNKSKQLFDLIIDDP